MGAFVPVTFPFSAIVGQETLKRALLLAVIQPSLGGVLIRGTKGVAKSTAVRALASLLPPIETVAACPFQRSPGECIADWPLPADSPVVTRAVPLVELPLGATEDRVLGSLHLEKAMRGQCAFEPGLLAAANRGILYIDEVNLLPDHLVDVLLDAAGNGVHRVEREGLSLCHPARFVLIGTMNPEEGELRPQLLDRFGLVVDVSDLTGARNRAEAVGRRLAYEADPETFVGRWQAADDEEARRVIQAQALLPRVRISEGVMHGAIERCLAAGAEGLRADLALCRAASAWAAYHARVQVEPADLDAVSELALAHRRGRPPEPSGPGGRSQASGVRGQEGGNGSQAGGTPPLRVGSAEPHAEVFQAEGLHRCRLGAPTEALARSSHEGRWTVGRSRRPGRMQGRLTAYMPGAALAWDATLRAAAPYQAERRGTPDNGRVLLRVADLRARPRHGPAGCLLFFLVDCSGSMAACQRMRRTKAAILALLTQAYQRRDRVAMLAFHGNNAELVLRPTRGLPAARRALEVLPVGGTTPLAQGLAAGRALIQRERRRDPQQSIWTVVLTDGRANVSISSNDPWQDALAEAKRLTDCASACLVIDTETGWPCFGRACELANALGADYLPLDDVLGKPLADPWRRAV
jgi:magnesium chelatase subunit D